MNSFSRILLTGALIIGIGSIDAGAQVIVRVRPNRPHYERIVAPSPRHVWIDEDWEQRSGAYVFIGGHWAEPPHPGVGWVPGHWRHRHGGWVWVPGHWR